MKPRWGPMALVTGAAGFMGSHLVERLRSMGLEVTGLDNFSSGCMKNLAALKSDKNFKLIRGDILNHEDLLRACKGMDLVVHMAAHSSVPGSTEDPLKDFRVNVIGTINVLECVRKFDIETVLFASSSTVYGEAKAPTHEDHPLHPISNYGASKLAGESYCRSYSSLYGIKAASLRYFNIFGPRLRRGVMFDLSKKLQQNKKELEVLGTGNQAKDYLYIDDAVDATLLIVEKGELRGEAYNVGSGKSYSVKQLVNGLLKLLGLEEVTKVVYRGGLSWPGDVQKTQANISKLRALGFTPKFTFENGLKSFVNWYKSEHGNI